jgi:hypothetical protein
MKCQKAGMNGLDGNNLPTKVSGYYRRKADHSYIQEINHAHKNNNFKTLR